MADENKTSKAADNLTANMRASSESGDSSKSVHDYLAADSIAYGMDQVATVHSIGYFLPLLRELFNVNDARTKVVFTMLYSLMIDDRVRWSRMELDEKFHWLRDGQRGYLLQRLSNVGWLEFYRDQGAYMITDKGEALMRILSRFTLGEALVDNEGAALAEIEFSMLLDLDDLPDRLKFLRNRLVKHNIRAQHALESDSAYRVLEVYQQLQAAYRWAEQTRQTLDEIENYEASEMLADGEEPFDQWEAIRSVHGHLSTLHSNISQMQLVLQDIQKKQINIAQYGLTHLDFDNYLINSSAEHLAEMVNRHLIKIPHALFMMENFVFEEARDILARHADQPESPRGWETEVSDADPEANPGRSYEAEEFSRALKHTGEDWQDMTEIVNTPRWEVAAYRLQLMTMLADLRALERLNDVDFDPLIDTSIEAEFDRKGKTVDVEQDGEVRTMTRGRYRRGEPIVNGTKETTEND